MGIANFLLMKYYGLYFVMKQSILTLILIIMNYTIEFPFIEHIQHH